MRERARGIYIERGAREKETDTERERSRERDLERVEHYCSDDAATLEGCGGLRCVECERIALNDECSDAPPRLSSLCKERMPVYSPPRVYPHVYPDVYADIYPHLYAHTDVCVYVRLTHTYTYALCSPPFPPLPPVGRTHTRLCIERYISETLQKCPIISLSHNTTPSRSQLFRISHRWRSPLLR